MDYCKYVNVFHGCGEYEIPVRKGIAAKWFFIKAGCGNTSPAACLPFGAMSVAPFSGGYPTGYGNHKPNSHSKPPKFEEGKGLIGFSHLQQSGTGAIGYYYNYAVVSPRYKITEDRRIPKNESARPGYYSCNLSSVKCEISASSRVAFHRYSFGEPGGMVTIDFTNNGLNIPGIKKEKVSSLSINIEKGLITASALIEGINIYFAVSYNGVAEIINNIACISGFGNRALLKVAISLRSIGQAIEYVNTSLTFDEAADNAYNEWNKKLSLIKIDTADERIKRIFYSNLYHSLVKPSDWQGESFIYDSDGPFCIDFATFWDMYKTALPLIFMTDKKMSEKIVETILSLGEKLGEIPNCIGISSKYAEHDTQARMLGAYVLMSAYHFGIKLDVNRMLDVIEKDLFSDNKSDFTANGKCTSHTFTLDMADACANAVAIAKKHGIQNIIDRLTPLAEHWKNVYSKETGLLNSDSEYYEGTLYNYSFRQMVNMDARIDIAGGKEKFVELLDDFFGYNKPDVILPVDSQNYLPVEDGMKLGRFEGFNNESDTESPYSYIYADRQDRTCEIIRAGMKYMFGEGNGGLPGNNDTGALSSYYVLAALGLFPVAGQNLMLIGSPFVDNATIKLSSGKKLDIKVNNNSQSNIYVKNVLFNGTEIKDYKIKISQIMNGGILEFTMSNKSPANLK